MGSEKGARHIVCPKINFLLVKNVKYVVAKQL